MRLDREAEPVRRVRLPHFCPVVEPEAECGRDVRDDCVPRPQVLAPTARSSAGTAPWASPSAPTSTSAAAMTRGPLRSRVTPASSTSSDPARAPPAPVGGQQPGPARRESRPGRRKEEEEEVVVAPLSAEAEDAPPGPPGPSMAARRRRGRRRESERRRKQKAVQKEKLGRPGGARRAAGAAAAAAGVGVGVGVVLAVGSRSLSRLVALARACAAGAGAQRANFLPPTPCACMRACRRAPSALEPSARASPGPGSFGQGTQSRRREIGLPSKKKISVSGNCDPSETDPNQYLRLCRHHVCLPTIGPAKARDARTGPAEAPSKWTARRASGPGGPRDDTHLVGARKPTGTS